MQESRENQPNFREFIELNKEMTPDEAIQALASFHKCSRENVLGAFVNLQGFTEGTIVFKESVVAGNPCLMMEGHDKNGQRVWDHLIDMYTGQPQVRSA